MRPRTRNARSSCVLHMDLPNITSVEVPNPTFAKADPRVRSLTPRRRTPHAKACSTRMRVAHSGGAAIHSCRLAHLPRFTCHAHLPWHPHFKTCHTAQLRKTPASAVAPAWPKTRQRTLLAGSSARQREGGGGRRSAAEALERTPREE